MATSLGWAVPLTSITLLSGCFDLGTQDQTPTTAAATFSVRDGSCPAATDGGAQAPAKLPTDGGTLGDAQTQDSATDGGLTAPLMGCAITDELVRVFSSTEYCDRVDACEVDFPYCRTGLWTKQEVEAVVWGLSFSEQDRCLTATQNLDDCVFALSCTDFTCYHDVDNCDSVDCQLEGDKVDSVCGQLIEVLRLNREATY